ncbi:hypothetical protein Lal_00020791 [Lupinus albus]|nr:hypothetical protein Lal_00020791 [Lupinus albus]
MCGELLGKVPIIEEDMRGCELKLAWLVDNFSQLLPNPTQIQLQQYCRACILYIIGGKFIPDKSNSRVHLMYLHLLRDLSRVNRYSWDSACLANLYREMCRATKPNGKAMVSVLGFSLERERCIWEGEILGYTGGFSPERELSRLGEKMSFWGCCHCEILA